MEVQKYVVVFFLLTLCCCAMCDEVVPIVNSIYPNGGGVNGGSRITIKGAGFENDTFDWPPGNNKGNLVNMVSLTRSYVCDIHKDGVASDKITCYTRPMEEDYYYVEVSINGVLMNESYYCPADSKLCRFYARLTDTPSVSSMSSQSGPPGQLITLTGKIMTRVYEANDLSRNATNGVQAAIIRTFGGDKICEMIKPSGGLYNLQLHSPTSYYGSLTCLMTTKFIGAMRVNFLVEIYGRSKPDPTLLKLYPLNVTGMYLQYPVITEIGPVEGSLEGFTYMTITGIGLNDTTKHELVVQVGGVDCEELRDVTYYSLVCVMPPQSKITGTFFKGSRGGTVRAWNTTVQTTDLADVPTMDVNDTTFWQFPIDDAKITVMKGTVGYAEAYFVPPVGGAYYFRLTGDSGCVCKSEISETMDPNSATLLNDNCDSVNMSMTLVEGQTALTLTEGKTYYIKIIFSTELVTSTSPVSISLSIFQLIAPYNEGRHFGSRNEKQRINLSGEDNDEIQTMTLPAPPAVSGGVDEVQTITITSADSALHFRLQLHGVPTGLLSSLITAADLQEAINKLSCVPDNIVTVAQNDSVYTVTFTGYLGNWPDFVVSYKDEGLTVVVAEVTAGQSDNSKLIIQHMNHISPPISLDASASKVQEALDKLFSVSCPKIQFSGNAYRYNDYEDEDDKSWGHKGSVVTVSEPFCGKSVLKNPTKLFQGDSSMTSWISLRRTGNQWMCFAYRGIFQQTIPIYYRRYYTTNNDRKYYNYWLDITSFNFSNDVTKWHYNCINLLDILEARHNDPSSYFFIRRIYVYPHKETKDDIYVDELMIVGPKPPITEYQDLPNQRSVPPVRATNIAVTKNDAEYTMTIDPWDCEPLDILSIRDQPTGGVTHARVQTGSVPVSGNVKLSRNGKNYVFPPNVKASTLGLLLESTDRDLGRLKVDRYGTCHGFSYHIEWLTKPGKQEPFVFDNSGLSGPPDVDGNLKESQSGGNWHSPIPAYMLHTVHRAPTETTKYPVTMTVNYLAADCNAKSSCLFTYSSDLMPTATDIQPRTGTKGTEVVITGTGFDDATIAANVLHLGNSALCVVTAATSTSFTCTLGVGDSGTFNAVVLVRGKGAAQIQPAIEFVYETTFSDYSPASCGLGGGLVATLQGTGLDKTTLSVEIGGTLCPTLSAHIEMIQCTIPPATSAGSVDVVLKDGTTVIFTHSTQFIYDSALTPTIVTVSSTVGSPTGGETLTLTGTGFGDNPARQVNLVDKTDAQNVYKAKVKRWSDTGFDVSLPPLSHGTYQLEAIVPDAGYATLSGGQLPEITSNFQVTDFNPKETSTYGGLTFTIAGTGFTSGTAVKIGSTKCRVENDVDITSTEIICHLDQVYETHEIHSTGEDNGYAWDPVNIVVELGDEVHWIWSSNARMPPKYLVQQTESLVSTEPLAGGFDSQERKSTGEFRYRTQTVGTVYYWSGQVSDVQPDTIPRGQITVIPKAGSLGVLSVSENMIEAKFSIAPSVRRRRAATCPSTYSSGCTNSLVPTGNTITLTPCLSGTMNTMTPNEGTAATEIVITGSGFGTDSACIQVHIYNKLLNIESVTDTEIRAKVKLDDPPPIHVALPIEVEILGRGNVLLVLSQADRSFTYKPNVASIQPASGSLAGNTLLSISGAGFVGNEAVNIDGVTCTIDEALKTTTQIICTTGPRTTEATNLLVAVTVNGYAAETCDTASDCQYSYLDSVTPQVTSVTPTSVPDPEANTGSTTLTIAGQHFSTDAASITVEIGDVACAVTSAAVDSIQCTVNNLPVGSSNNMIMVEVKPYGNNKLTDDVKVTGLKLVRQIQPPEGSTMGGTLVTIEGNGFLSDTTVTIDGAPCPTTSITLAQVICKTPEHTAGAVDVVITSSGETYDTVTYSFSDAATPTLDSITPTSSFESGTSVTIAGTLFSTNSGDNDVTINGIACTVTTATATEIVCILGSVPAGTYPVVVNVAGKGLVKHTTPVTFTYDIAISAISPTEGSYGGGQIVTVTGQGLSDSVTVKICDMPCPVSSTAITATQYICNTPSHTGSGDTPCDVVAVAGSVTTTALSAAYTYKDSLTPTVTAINPTRGGTGGGTAITVTGSNFGLDMTLLDVKIDDVPCVVGSISDGEFVCTTGEHRINIKAPVIVNKQGQGQAKYMSPDEFHYIDVWSSKYTWGGISVPEKGDFVVVPAGMTLLLDTNTPILKLLLVQGGTLMFDDTQASIELNAENILITDGGLFQIGTSENPYQNQAIITLHGNVRAPELPVYGAKTFALRNGSVEFHGNPTPSTWTLLGETAEVGDTTLQLQVEPNNWRVGDYIVVASTGDHMSQHQNEKVEITAITGNTITFKPALEYRHLGITEVYGSTSLELRAEVGLLTHNIIFRGSINQEFVTNIPACEDGFDPGQFATQKCLQGRFGDEIGSDQFGVQFMVHNPVKNSNAVHVHIEYVEITFAGQAYRLGRYPVHFHRNGDMRGSYIRGCSIHWTFNRAINIHDTHWLMIEHNVIYHVMGGAVFLEDSIEHDNTLQYNLVLFVIASSSLLNDDITPAAFWITHPSNIVRHNNVAGGTHFGFWYRMHEHPIGPSYDPSICPRKAELYEFYNNTVHSVGWYGLWVFEYYDPMTPTSGSQCSWGTPQPAIFKKLITWNSFRGAEFVEGGALQFHAFVVANNFMAGLEAYFVHGNVPKYSENGALIKDCVIIGHLNYDGHPPSTTTGIVLPFANAMLVQHTSFYNFEQGVRNGNTVCAALGTVKIICVCSYLCSGYDYRFSDIYWDSTAQMKANFEWVNQMQLVDMDGSLTGAGAGARVFATSNILPVECVDDAGFGSNLPAKVCPGSARADAVRFSFNNPSPRSLLYKDVRFTPVDDSGEPTGPGMDVPWRDKQDTYAKGWVALLIANRTYQMTFVGMERIVNISYAGAFYGLEEYSWIKIMHKNMFTDSFDDFDNIQVLSSVSSDNTVKVERPPQYGDQDGTIQVISSTADKQLTYLISGQNKGTYSDSAVSFKAIKCLFPGCIIPDSEEITLANERPADAGSWSESSTWEKGAVWSTEKKDVGSATEIPPLSSTTQVKITAGTWVVVDVPLIEVDLLVIEGTLEFEYLPTSTVGSDPVYMNHILKANHVVIKGGRLLAGYNKNIYRGSLDIILTGTLASPSYTIEDGPTIGAKALGVYGALELHGIPHDVIWTKLQTTAVPGSTTVTVIDPVDWAIGDEFVIATTGYSAWETETRVITKISDSKTNIEFNSPLLYTHLGESHSLNGAYSGVRFHIQAEVGLLSHNIRIMGDTSDDATYTESVPYSGEAYGARVIVGRTIDLRDPNDVKTFLGYANISNVQFHHTSQDGYTEPTDPRFSLTFMDLQQVLNTKVKDCSFVRGFGTAIGIFGSNGVTIENNVFYRTIGHAILDMGTDNRFLNNLATMNLWPGTFNGRNERLSKFYEAAIEINKATDPIIQGNVVAGAERSGYRIDGEHCDDTTTPDANRWRDNTAHSTMMGIYMMFDEDDCHGSDKCSEISNFIVYKAWNYGFYSQITCNLRFRNMRFYDNNLSVFSVVLGPNLVQHEFANRYIDIEGGLFVGQSPSFDCEREKLLPADSNNYEAGVSAIGWSRSTALTKDGSARRYGKIGIGATLFMSADNMAPDPGKPFHLAKETVAMYGITTIKGTYFAYFGKTCDSQYDVIISTNPINPDLEHVVTLEGIKRDSSVDMNSLVFISSPSKRFVSTDECVDMACEAKKTFFVEDKDGNFMGRKGTILPDAAFEYNGNKVFGIGDYRIPVIMASTLDGSKIPTAQLYDHKGIVGTNLCRWKSGWNAYDCPDVMKYERLVLESMDEDFMTRRLSPFVTTCEDFVGDKSITIASNPRSVGICHGYACTARPSIFFIIAAKATTCTAYFTGSTPQTLRLHTYGIADSWWTIYRIYMGQQYRYDVSYNGLYMAPPNFIAAKNKYERNPASNPTFYLPKSTDASGANYFDVETKLLHVLIKGPGIIDIKLTPQIIMATTMELITEDDFFASDTLIRNLANFLQIDPSKIKIMDVVSESSRRRRSTRNKRGVGIVVIFMIGNDVPSASTSGSASAANISTDTLIAMSNKLILESQVGSMSDVFGTEISGIQVARPAPPPADTDAWEAYTILQENAADNGGNLLQPVYKPRRMDSAGPATGETSYEGKPFLVAPRFKILDNEDRLVPLLAAPDGNGWQVQATLNKSNAFSHREARLVGVTTVTIVNGYAEFTTLGISHAGYNYKIHFAVINPSDVGPGYNHTMNVPVVPKRALTLNTVVSKTALKYEEVFYVEVVIKEQGQEYGVEDLLWKGDTWTGRVYLNGMIDQQVELLGNSNITFSNYGYKKVSNLALRGPPGKYALSVIVRTANADYAMVLTKTVELLDVITIPKTADYKVVELKFDEDFAKVQANKEIFLMAVYNLVKKVTTRVEFYNMDAWEGSIIVNFTCHGDMEDVDTALKSISAEIKENGAIRFGDTKISYSPYMKVGGEAYQGLDGKRPHLSKAIMITLCVLGALLALAIIIVVVVFCCKKYNNKSRLDSDSTSNLKKDNEYLNSSGGHGTSNKVYIHDQQSTIVYDEKSGGYKNLDCSRPSSGYSSKGSVDISRDIFNENNGGTVVPPVGKKPKSKQARSQEVIVGANVSTGGRPESSISRPSTGMSRPTSRSSVISKQGIRTSFSPRLSIDEGAGPNKIATIGD